MLAPLSGQSFKSGHMDRRRDTLMNRRSPRYTSERRKEAGEGEGKGKGAGWADRDKVEWPADWLFGHTVWRKRMGRGARTNKEGETRDENWGEKDDKNSSEASENSRAERRNVSVNEMEGTIKDFFQTYFLYLNGARVTFATGCLNLHFFGSFGRLAFFNLGMCMYVQRWVSDSPREQYHMPACHPLLGSSYSECSESTDRQVLSGLHNIIRTERTNLHFNGHRYTLAPCTNLYTVLIHTEVSIT